MGVMRFLIPRDFLPDRWTEYDRAYLTSFDGRVFATQSELDENVLCCRRHVSDSGRLHVVWPVRGFGRPVLMSSTLCERERPYLLPVELARGKICQVRNQLSAWERMGMTIASSVREALHKAHHLFARAISQPDDPEESCRLSSEALVAAVEAAESLTQSYCAQRIVIRRCRSERLPASLGCNLAQFVPSESDDTRFCAAFNSAAIPAAWKLVEQTEGEYQWETFDMQLDWAERNRLLVRGGPLLDFSARGLPAWLDHWQEDVLNLQSFMCDFVETAVTRYVGRIRIWEIASRVNTGGALGLSEEDRISLIARTVRVARQVDEEAQLYIGVEQPCGDYMAEGSHRFSALDFVDALMRFGIGLTGVILEVNLGYTPFGSVYRDILDFSRLIDQWSALEIPLQVSLAFPNSAEPDAMAYPEIQVLQPVWKTAWSEAAQAEWIDQYLPLLLAKQAVVGVYWSHFTDSALHAFPNAGLIDAHGASRQALDRIAAHHARWK